MGQVVVVQLSDRKLRGKLAGFDEFLNLHLQEAEDLGKDPPRRLGEIVVRGSQVLAIHATKLGPPVPEERAETVWSGNRSERGGYYPSRRDDGRG